MDEIKQETIEDKLKRISLLIQEGKPDESPAFFQMRKVAEELVELLELNFKIMASARKILTL